MAALEQLIGNYEYAIATAFDAEERRIDDRNCLELAKEINMYYNTPYTARWAVSVLASQLKPDYNATQYAQLLHDNAAYIDIVRFENNGKKDEGLYFSNLDLDTLLNLISLFGSATIFSR